MEEKRLQRLERHSRLYHWAGSVGKWLQEQNHGDVVYLSNGNGAVTFPGPPGKKDAGKDRGSAAKGIPKGEGQGGRALPCLFSRSLFPWRKCGMDRWILIYLSAGTG